ncbi:MAG TPA: hypothetical protein VKF14_12205 [Candidatus Dormibacteraeota bacterium]|nr:hypothetical protein [Candidatus Dormibacteraeota bacterium]
MSNLEELARRVGGEDIARFDLEVNFRAHGRIGRSLRAVAKVLHSGREPAPAAVASMATTGRLVVTATDGFIIYLSERQS